MSGAVLVLNIILKGLLVLGSMRSQVFRIDIHSLVPLPKRLQLSEKIKDVCRNEKHTSHWCHFSIISGQLLLRKLHSKE